MKYKLFKVDFSIFNSKISKNKCEYLGPVSALSDKDLHHLIEFFLKD
jgi:hypothetical protein